MLLDGSRRRELSFHTREFVLPPHHSLSVPVQNAGVDQCLVVGRRNETHHFPSWASPLQAESLNLYYIRTTIVVKQFTV